MFASEESIEAAIMGLKGKYPGISRKVALPHQAGIELSDFHARGWKSDQGGRNSMQEMHGNQTKCMEFRPIKENSNF